MSSTTFVDNQTVIYAAWLNDVNTVTYNTLLDYVAGGTSDALTATIVPAITALSATSNTMIIVRAASANATTTPTFTPNPGVVAPVVIQKNNGQALAVGDIAGAGHWLELQWDYLAGVWILLNPSTTAIGQLPGRNVIVNGDCSISQVNGGSLITPVTGTWPIDNVSCFVSQASKLQAQQVTGLVSLGATSALTTTVLSSYTPISTDYFLFQFPIEGYNFARFAYGTSAAKAGSLQFKARASVAGTYSAIICNYGGTRSYGVTFNLAANTDTLVQLPNIPGDTGGTWVYGTNAGAAFIRFNLGAGSSSTITAGSWQAGSPCGVTGTTNLVSQVNGSTLTITDVQFEVGSVCTQFERKLYPQNLFECMRYLRIIGSGNYDCLGQAVSTTSALLFSQGPPMRATPSYSQISAWQISTANGGGTTVSSASVLSSSSCGSVVLQATVGSGLVAGNASYILAGGTAALGAQI